MQPFDFVAVCGIAIQSVNCLMIFCAQLTFSYECLRCIEHILQFG